MNERGQRVQSVERAFRITECFSIEKPELSLGEIAKKTGLTKSTVFRLLSTLLQLGYIKQDWQTQRYSLGFKFFHLGAIVISNTMLRETAIPFMKKLSEETDETISLNIAEQNERVCIEVVESPQQIRNFVKVGQRNALWSGASGKALLAYLMEEERQLILGEQAEKLERELYLIRKQGCSISTDDRVKGSFAIAAPIFDHRSQIVGGLTLAGPIHRLTEEREPVLVRQVIQAAHQVSEQLGFIQRKLG
ncbi:IclR family transcriptional regulator [Ammoniphilus sp. YIM 78166]|uniref:IclR family transcriptional regulator n=1 Tax=Ammoniphilus sp. YIM 78166 TaxID=1644106 RepID=UPI00106F5ACA|nr:IclR family transcriptional regulator [Ammoniphilus sp. YIM 78166]